MLGQQIRERLHDGRPVYGTHVTLLGNTPAASILASRAGLDFAFLCAEHMPLDRTEMSAVCAQFASHGIAPMVRLSHPSAVDAAQALDLGAQGIVAPYVETVAQADEVAAAVHYRPIKGQILRDFRSGARKPTAKTREFLAGFNTNNLAIIGIESVPAYENLDALIAVEGVDGVFIGPHDVTVSMEMPEEYDNPEFLRVLEDIIVRCRAAGVGVGVHISPLAFRYPGRRRGTTSGASCVS